MWSLKYSWQQPLGKQIVTMFLRQTRLLKSGKIFKNSFRNCSVNAEIKSDDAPEENIQNKYHIYKKQMKKSEVVNYLAENVVYTKDDIIVTNKPYGVGKAKATRKIDNYVVQTFTELTLDDVLPDLATALGFDSLRLVKAPERLASGVTILAATDEAQEKASENILYTKRREEMTDTYLTICIGHPSKKNLETRFGIKLKDKKSAINSPIVVDKYTINSVKQKEVRPVKWIHDELSSSKHASLLRVQLSLSHKNSLRMYLATKCLSPVLGDLLYSSRVENVLGVALLKDPSVCVVGAPPKLHPEMLSALEISENEVTLIPNMVHLYSVNVFFTKKCSTVLSVPPPEFFVWTCKQLGLNFDENSFNEIKCRP